MRALSGVLGDHYSNNYKLQVMKVIQNADLDILFDMFQREQLKNAIASRTILGSVYLIRYPNKLPAPTFRETFANTIKDIAAQL